jgi:hypothetical protein
MNCPWSFFTAESSRERAQKEPEPQKNNKSQTNKIIPKLKLMADFVEKEGVEVEVEAEVESTEVETALKEDCGVSNNMDPMTVVYCPKCTLPPEYCEHGPCFDECLPWILKNFPQVLSDEMLATMLGEVEVGEEDKPKKKNKGPKLKKSVELATGKTQVVIAKVQRQKRKFITAVAGLETVPGRYIDQYINI